MATLQLSQQLQMALSALSNTEAQEQAVSAALVGGGQAASANPNLGQLVNLSV